MKRANSSYFRFTRGPALYVLITCIVGLLAASPGAATTVNLLSNPGFETGDFSGWTIGGNSTGFGVATDGTPTPLPIGSFWPNYVNVRSGTYAGWAFISGSCCAPQEFITLSQTVPVLPNEPATVGFYMGNDSST